MAETLISYELYAMIQSIINKRRVNISIPYLIQPAGWVATYTTIDAGVTGVITTPTVLSKSGSYLFQLETTVQYSGSGYNAQSIEVRLYYGSRDNVLDLTTASYYALTTRLLNDPVADGVINTISTVLVPNIVNNQQYLLGYSTASTGSGSANINYTIRNVFFIQYAGIQNDQALAPIFSILLPTPADVSLPHTPSDNDSGFVVTLNNPITNAIIVIEWDIQWNAQNNPLQMIGFGLPTAYTTFPYDIYDLENDSLSTPTRVVGGNTIFYFTQITQPSAETAWAFQISQKVGGIPLQDLTVYLYY